MCKVVEYGRVSQDGGVKLPMDRVRQELRKSAGKRVLVTFVVMEEPSEAMLGYYYGYILPTVRKALYELGEIYTDDETSDFLSSAYGSDEWKHDKDEMRKYIEFLQQYAAENLDVYIHDPE